MPKTSNATDIKWLLRQAADGIEDAEALLPRFRRADDAGAPQLTPAWETACDHLETLADLRDESVLSSAQEQQCVDLLRRVAKLRADLQRFELLEPRLDWSQFD